MSFFKKYFGPSTLVTAAFIGPGTLTVCTVVGADFGYSLLWVLLFAVIATIILQEMAARLGLITQKGLGEAIRTEITNPSLRVLSIALVFMAIVFGNAAYEAGNISGSALGIGGVFGDTISWPLIIGLAAFIILFIGKIKIIEKILIALVLLMSIVFILTAIVIRPDVSEILSGLFIPSFSSESQLAILALIGTTVVPYNLFLHASSVSQKWKNKEQLSELRVENGVAIGIGGLISIAIVITSAAALFGKGSVSNINDMAVQLEPLMGNWARIFLAIGLFAAGISSSITAPLAAALTAKGIFHWEGDEKSLKFRLIWFFVLGIGTAFSMAGYSPIEVIRVAQIANGILLPVIVFFLIYISNKKSLLGDFTNKPIQNVLAGLVIIVSLVISFRSFNSVFNFI